MCMYEGYNKDDLTTPNVYSWTILAMCFHQELRDDLYQKIAAEMNLSETAFITLINPTDNFTTGKVNAFNCDINEESVGCNKQQ